MSDRCGFCESFEDRIAELEGELSEQETLRMEAEQERDSAQNELEDASQTITVLTRDYKAVLEHNKELEHRLSLYQEDGKRWLDVGR